MGNALALSTCPQPESLLAPRVALFEKAKELSAGRVERTLLIFGLIGDERSTFVVDGLSVPSNCLEFLASARSQTALLGTWSAAAGAQATERPGSNPIWLHWLVRDLDEIVWRHTGQRIKRSEKWEPWVHEICRFAAPNIKPGSVTGALRAITKGRGKINQRKRSTILPHTTVK